jgi:hypothetical protein
MQANATGEGAMNSQAPKMTKPGHAAIHLGLALWAVSLVWWFLYYAQYQGPFELLGPKFGCFTGASAECLRFQKWMGPTAIPAYLPIFWYAGMLAMIAGSVQAWRAGALAKAKR